MMGIFLIYFFFMWKFSADPLYIWVCQAVAHACSSPGWPHPAVTGRDEKQEPVAAVHSRAWAAGIIAATNLPPAAHSFS